ncbi:MAG: ATP-binding cassette domain-containing protein [Propionibacteriaceae bacterium]|jgi:ABC-2 type transport system ATP-binding protein|nr:ATP-binding cassette domain-containing protein [Propionibacteriaceae bacterium]
MAYGESAAAPPRGWAIEAVDVKKRFGGKPALDGFTLRVKPGSVCGLLGPNGAGKTTAVRILTTLMRPDAGEVRVGGIDVRADPGPARYRIGLVGQNTSVDDILTGRQNLVLFGKLYHLSTAAARRRADDLLGQFDLASAANRAVSGYSGGMRRRLDLAASLILAPPVLFLDEPTAGLDPRARMEVWTMVKTIVGTGATALLTTQYLEEADHLADQIALIDAGRVVAEGTPDELKAKVGPDRVETVVRKPTLDEVFMSLTGRHATTAATHSEEVKP